VAVLAGIYLFTLGSREPQVELVAVRESTAAGRNEQEDNSQPGKSGQLIDENPLPPNACPNKQLIDPESPDSDWFRERTLRHAKALSATNDAEYLLAAALLSRWQGAEHSLRLLERAARIAPTNRIIAASRLRLCRESPTPECNTDSVVATALEVDGDNGAVLMEVAMLRLAADRIPAAETLVRRAIDAPRFDNYFIDYAKLIERAAATRGDSSYRDRMIEGIGYSAAMSVSYYKITTFCNAVEQQNTAWLSLCDDLGKKMVTAGRSLLDNMIGASLRKIAAQKSGVESRIKATAEAYDSFRHRYTQLMQNREGMGLLENDEAVLRRYVDTFSTYGELQALELLNDEVKRLKKLPGYDLCNLIPIKFVSGVATNR